MEKVVDLLQRGAKEIGVALTPVHIEQFKNYCSLLIKWNERVNLTAIIDPREIAVKHFIDSLVVLSIHQISNGARIIDVGTGAGFPGLPLKIVRPDLELVLLDSLHKRIQFLQAVVDQLALSQVVVVHGRAEEKGQDPKYREDFDIVLARAVAPLNILAELCLPFVRLGGFFLAMKGPEVQAEITQAQAALTMLGGRMDKTSSFLLPISRDPRSSVLIKKISVTPAKYPRRPGMPEKKPL